MGWLISTFLFVIFYYIVVAKCGASVAENCTYFESSGGEIGFKYLFSNNINDNDER